MEEMYSNGLSLSCQFHEEFDRVLRAMHPNTLDRLIGTMDIDRPYNNRLKRVVPNFVYMYKVGNRTSLERLPTVTLDSIYMQLEKKALCRIMLQLMSAVASSKSERLLTAENIVVKFLDEPVLVPLFTNKRNIRQALHTREIPLLNGLVDLNELCIYTRDELVDMVSEDIVECNVPCEYSFDILNGVSPVKLIPDIIDNELMRTVACRIDEVLLSCWVEKNLNPYTGNYVCNMIHEWVNCNLRSCYKRLREHEDTVYLQQSYKALDYLSKCELPVKYRTYFAWLLDCIAC